jgi:hypothetical protein
MTRVQRRDEPLYEEPVTAQRTTPRARPAARQTERKNTVTGRPLPFKIVLIGDRLKIICILGAIAILLISLLGIVAGFSAAGTDAAKALTNTTALVVTPTASPLFWIGFLISASLIWRIFCEIAAIVYRMYEPVSSGGDAPSFDDEMPEDVEGTEEMYECPHCGKVVLASQLRECEHCGVQGCSHCIRMMGLIKKTMTCKDCFEKK